MNRNHLWSGILFCFDLISIKSKVSAITMLLINDLMFSIHDCLNSPNPLCFSQLATSRVWHFVSTSHLTFPPKDRCPFEIGADPVELSAAVQLAPRYDGAKGLCETGSWDLCCRRGSIACGRHWNPQTPSKFQKPKETRNSDTCVPLCQCFREWSLKCSSFAEVMPKCRQPV